MSILKVSTYSFFESLSTSSPQNSYKKKLDEWLTVPTLAKEDRVQVAQIFSSFIEDSRSKALSFENLSISSLPDVFDCEPFCSGLERLYICDTHLSELPPTITKLKALRILELNDTPLQNLPGDIGELEALELLDITRTELSSLPEGISRLKRLKNLFAMQIRLRVLPEQFCDLESLESVSLYDSMLESLPANFGRLKKLRELDLAHTNIESLPASFFQLPMLETVDLSSTNISELPKEFENMRHLKDLFLCEMIHLEYLPNSLFCLSEDLTVDVDGIPFSPEYLARIREEIEHPDYQGPTFKNLSEGNENILNALSEMFKLTSDQRDWSFLNKIDSSLKPHLITWISRLDETADGAAQKKNFSWVF